MGIRDEYDVDGVPEDAEEDGEERYEDDLDDDYIEEREDLLTLMEMEETWARQHAADANGDTLDDAYEAAVDMVEELDYGKELIQKYCRERTWTADRQSRRRGLFLSALINEHDGEEYVLPDLSAESDVGWRDGLDYVGYRNEDDITVEGTVGNEAGLAMADGTLTVEDHAGANPGKEMTGGRLHIKKSAGGMFFDGVGQDMDGGTLIVDGDVCGDAGHSMQDGRIQVGGDVLRSVGPRQQGGMILFEGGGSVAPNRRGGTVHRKEDGGYQQIAPFPDLDLGPLQSEVEALWEACREWRHEDRESYDKAVEAVDPLEYSPDGIYAFAEHSIEHPYDGVFVSALINEHDGDQYTLPDMADVAFIGMHASDTITVEGDVGASAGRALQGGTLTVEGDAGDNLGLGMTDGRIRVHGTIASHPVHPDGGTIEQEQNGAWVART